MRVGVLERPATAPNTGQKTGQNAEEQSVAITRRKFTVAEYYQMLHAGILSEDDRVELIDGEIRAMSAIDAIHAGQVKRLSHLLNRFAGDQWIISVQDPIHLAEFDEPEPDIAILRWRDDFYDQQHPTPSDVLLVIEIANTSLTYDRQEKLPRYAAAGIAEVWLIDAKRGVIEQYAQSVSGRFTVQQIVRRGAQLQAATLPTLSLPVDQIFGLSQQQP